MVVGLATIVLMLDGAASLKDKRRVSKSVIARVRARFNVAVAEVDSLDSHSELTLAIACVSTEPGHAHGLLEKAIAHIERERLDASLAQVHIEML